MNQVMLQDKKSLRPKIIFIILTLQALAFSMLRFMYCFIGDDYGYIRNHGNWRIEFIFPTSPSFWIWLILNISPWVLLTVYALFLHSKQKSYVSIAVVFFIIAFSPIFEYIDFILEVGSFPLSLRGTLFYSPLMISFVLGGISALKDIHKKVFPIIAITIGFIYEIYNLIHVIRVADYKIENKYYLSFCAGIFETLGTIVLLVALLFFILNSSTIINITNHQKKKLKTIERMTPEHALKTLNESFELGIITEEEYQTQRAEIISKL